jgi:Protein of unknown function (DUF3102)
MTKRKNRSLEIIADDIHRLERTSIFDIGDLLIEAKEQCKHGQWLEWLDNEFDYAVSTAERYMNATRLRAKFPTVRNLKLAASTIYRLADCANADYLPPVIQELAKHATVKRLTHADAERVIDVGVGRHRHGNYPDATLVRLASFSDEKGWHADAIAALKNRRPITDQDADAIVDAVRSAHREVEQVKHEAKVKGAEEARSKQDREISATLDGPQPKLPPPTAPPELQKIESGAGGKWTGANEFVDAVKSLFALRTEPVERFADQSDTDAMHAVIDFLRAVAAATEAKKTDAKVNAPTIAPSPQPTPSIASETGAESTVASPPTAPGKPEHTGPDNGECEHGFPSFLCHRCQKAKAAAESVATMTWLTTPDGKVYLAATPTAEFKVTDTGSNFTLARKTPGARWTPDNVIGCFPTIDAAKAAVAAATAQNEITAKPKPSPLDRRKTEPA